MVEIIVAFLFVSVAVAFIFIRLTKARKEAELLRDEQPEIIPAPSIEAPAPERRERLGTRVRTLLSRGGADAWETLEDLLLKADVGPTAATQLVERVRARWSRDADAESLLREEMVEILGPDARLSLPDEGLGVIMVVGVNGSGKTTTIGKLARRLAGEGRSVSIAGADTFRAAAGEQLEVWAVRAGAHLISQERGADPGSVVFDAVKSATARGSDVLIVDTAGRLHTKAPLMDELQKIGRVIEKAGARVAETLLVLDATTGQNGIAQARAFTEAVQVSGIVLTKLDGTAKGGVVLAVREELGVSVRLVGTGEGSRRHPALPGGALRGEDPGVVSARILIVEDHPTMREAMRLVLEGEGFDIDEASDGDQALAAVREDAPDLVLLDMSIPGVAGPDVLSALKSDPATSDVRVIVVTAIGEEGRAAAMASGADHYFTKPFSPIALLQAVEEVLGPKASAPGE